MSCAEESLSLDVLSAVLFVLSNNWPDISTVKNMSNKCGMYEPILSALDLLLLVAMTSEVAYSLLHHLTALLLE